VSPWCPAAISFLEVFFLVKNSCLGKVDEIRQDLHKDHKKKDALKRTLANATLGNDMSSLITDILPLLSSADILLKKTAIQIVLIYAKARPELMSSAIDRLAKVIRHELNHRT
jgi:vesicle coat complex subunit